MKKILIIGCGYVGMPLGELLARKGHHVFGLRRSADADPDLQSRGITPIHADITSDLTHLDPNFDAIVNLVSSTKGGIDDYRRVYLEGTRNILNWLSNSARPAQLYLYTSSTSVYAQTDGSWVTENSPAHPDSPTSQILLETERELLSSNRPFPIFILRASGIYGPGRGHLFKQFLRGEATMRDDGSAWINMIHVHDLAAAIAHFIENPSLPPGIYNTTDNQPVTQRDFFQWLATQLNRPMPPPAPTAPVRKRGLTNKRVSNAKLRATGFQFTHPTFREGYTPELRAFGGGAPSPHQMGRGLG